MTKSYKIALWLQLAEKARAAARRTRDQDVKLRTALIGARYLVMAKRAEQAEALNPPTKKDRPR
jgi:hypothetical protein